jgi:hypothetical protein
VQECFIMPDSAYHSHPDATRALQDSVQARTQTLAKMHEWGAYNLLKVVTLSAAPVANKDVAGYITILPAISGCIPEEMVSVLGLNAESDLKTGAAIYQLLELPAPDGFQVRGYTTLPDGLRLKPGVKVDAGGYGPGRGAWQIRLTRPVPARLFAVVHPGNPFKPPLHPRVAALYPPGHPAALR